MGKRSGREIIEKEVANEKETIKQSLMLKAAWPQPNTLNDSDISQTAGCWRKVEGKMMKGCIFLVLRQMKTSLVFCCTLQSHIQKLTVQLRSEQAKECGIVTFQGDCASLPTSETLQRNGNRLLESPYFIHKSPEHLSYIGIYLHNIR